MIITLHTKSNDASYEDPVDLYDRLGVADNTLLTITNTGDNEIFISGGSLPIDGKSYAIVHPATTVRVSDSKLFAWGARGSSFVVEKVADAVVTNEAGDPVSITQIVGLSDALAAKENQGVAANLINNFSSTLTNLSTAISGKENKGVATELDQAVYSTVINRSYAPRWIDLSSAQRIALIPGQSLVRDTEQNIYQLVEDAANILPNVSDATARDNISPKYHGDVVTLDSNGQAYWWDNRTAPPQWIGFGSGTVGAVPPNPGEQPNDIANSWAIHSNSSDAASTNTANATHTLSASDFTKSESPTTSEVEAAVDGTKDFAQYISTNGNIYNYKIDKDGKATLLNPSIFGFGTLIEMGDSPLNIKQWYNTEDNAYRGFWIRDPVTGWEHQAQEESYKAVETIQELSTVHPNQKYALLSEKHRSGSFLADTSDLSGKVALDLRQGRYVPFSSDPTGASGAWVRTSKSIIPDHFKNDSDADDYDCLKACADFVSSVEVLPIELIKRTYNINRYKVVDGTRAKVVQFTSENPDASESNGVDDIIFSQVDGLEIFMHGAIIQHGGGHRKDNDVLPYSNTNSICPLFFDRCKNLAVYGPGIVDGGASGWSVDVGVTSSGPSHGICVFGGSDASFWNITSQHWMADGFWVGGYTPVGSSNRDTAVKVRTYNCNFLENARQGCSIVGCNDYADYGSSMCRNGFVDTTLNQSTGLLEPSGYQAHDPSNGFNCEPLPFNTLPSTVKLFGTKIHDNAGGPLSSSQSEIGQSPALNKDMQIVNCSMSFDWEKYTKLRATTSVVAMGSDGLRVIGGDYKDVGFTAYNGDHLIVTGATISICDTDCAAFVSTEAEGIFLQAKDNVIVCSQQDVVQVNIVTMNGKSAFIDNDVTLSSRGHDGSGNDTFAIFSPETQVNGNSYKTNLYSVAVIGQVVKTLKQDAVKASDADEYYENLSGTDVVLTGTTEAELLADGLTKQTSGFLYWRLSGGPNDNTHVDNFGAFVSDSASGHGWSKSNTGIDKVLTANSTRQLTYGIDESSIIIDSINTNVTFTLKTVNVPEGAEWQFIRTDTSTNTLTVSGVEIVSGENVKFVGESGAWVKRSSMATRESIDYSAKDYADDASAATGGVKIGGVYHSGGAAKVRIA